MSPKDFTHELLIGWGGQDVFNQAMGIGARMEVAEAHWDAARREARGKISQPNGWEMPTGFTLDDKGCIHSSCPCRTNQEFGMVCPHVVAIALQLMYRMNDPVAEGKYQQEQRTARRIAAIDPAKYIRRDPKGLAMRLSCRWEKSVFDEFRAGKVTVTLEFQGADGRRYTPESLCGHKVAMSSAADELLSVLEDVCEGPATHRIEMNRADFLNVATLLAKVPPVAVTLVAEFDEANGEFELYPRAELPFAHDPSKDVFLVEGKTGLVWSTPLDGPAAGRLCATPLKKVIAGPFQSLYEQSEKISRAAMPGFLKGNLPLLRAMAPVEMNPTEDMFRFLPGEPVMRLTLTGSGGATLGAELRADYGGGQVVRCCAPAAADAICLPDPDDVLLYRVRNLPAEEEALKALTGCGFELNESATRHFLNEPRDVLNFLGSGIPRFIRMGWKVDASEKLQSFLDKTGSIIPVVDVSDAGSGGEFDVGCGFDDGGRKIPPSEIEAALNRGDAYLRHRGELLLIDADAVKTMRKVFADCPSRESAKPGHFRMGSVYAPYVQSSLGALGDAMDIEDAAAPNWRETALRRNRDESAQWEPVPLGALETTLRPYQKQGVYWMRFLEKSGLSGLLADEMGLGKTLQTLTWLSLERTDPDARGKPALVICPTSLVQNWNAEAEKFVPHLKRLVVSGPERAESFARIPEADLVITSYALLQRDLEDAYLGKTFSVVVLDEAQHIKNRQTRNAKAAKRLDSVQKLVLTGTPVENSVADVWSIFDFLMPDYLGRYDLFKATTQEPIEAGGPEGKAEQEKLHRKLHPFILRRLKQTVAKDLPEKIVKVAYCPLAPEQQRWYNKLLADARGKIGNMVKEKGFAKSRMEILALLMRLRQVSSHVALLKEYREKHPNAPAAGNADSASELSGKLDVFRELLDEAIDGGHRVLVFSQFVTMLTLLRQDLDARGIRYCYLDGSTKDRLGVCGEFNRDSSIPLFLISLHAGGTGLNLTGADMVVHFDPWWNPAVEAQATDRAHRIGQKRTVYVVKMIAEGTVEEKVLALQQKKQLVIDATVGATDAQTMEKLTYDDVRSLVGL